MSPSPHDSDDDPIDEIFAPINDPNIDDEEPGVEVMALNENDPQPGIEELAEDLDFQDVDQIENGYLPDDSIMVFQQHEGSVFSVNFSPTDSSIAVSGGEDDKGYVWKTDNGEVLLNCDGHKDSVICCGFNADGKYVMTADMAGSIVVWSVSDGSRVWEFDCSDLEWCFWHPSINVLFAGTADGEVFMWKVPSGDCKIYQGHGSKSISGRLLSSGKELIVGYEDGSIKLWDLKNTSVIFSYQDNSDTVLCVAGSTNGSLIAYGSQEGCVKVFSSPAGKLVATLPIPNNPRSTEQEGNDCNIESIVFSPSDQYIGAGSINGTLYIWDLTTQRVRHQCTHPAGISHVVGHESSPFIFITACLDGTIRLWDYRSGEMTKELQGHRDHILDISLSKDGKYILTAGDDKSSRVFEK